MINLKDLLAKLISFASITPHDAGCQEYIINFLQQLGFHCQRFNQAPVANFFARIGDRPPLLVFAGHSDVVPVGDATKWHTAPFVMQEVDDILYGRGVADMKGSLAAMLIMMERFITKYPNFDGSLGMLVTSGEEGDDFMLGTPYIMSELAKQSIKLDYCVLGEPSSSKQLGDVIKIGRRGSLTGKLTLNGKQGHVAYPHLADNPIHKISPVLAALTSKCWDLGNQHFPPTSMQITRIESGLGGSNNMIPGVLHMNFNFRFSTEQTVDKLQQAVINSCKEHGLDCTIEWLVSGQPFLTGQGKLLDSSIAAIQKVTDLTPELSTDGGTSDGRFIAPYGVEIIELGPINATIHQVNESVALADLEALAEIYYVISENILM